jgi:GntR family transcriptional regulator/MocR family aminotransferase
LRDAIFHVSRTDMLTLQKQIRERLVAGILAGTLPPGSPVPSTRVLAKRLNVSRNTVAIAYQSLASDGFLVPRERSGFFVSPEIDPASLAAPADGQGGCAGFPFAEKLQSRPSQQKNIVKPDNWHDYPFAFIYGQTDPALFPFHEWRECTHQAVSRRLVEAWTDDSVNRDDPVFVEQIRQRLLPRRGIDARPEEILVTMGAQNAIFLLASLAVGPQTRVGVEDPGYPDARNIFAMRTSHLVDLPVDEGGLAIGGELADCDVAYVTPSHQMPTNVTMDVERRRALLDWARERGALVIEDDYEFETNYIGQPTPALKSLDRSGNVAYVGSLSKSLVPGLRLGYLVAPPPLIEEARALRRLMLRHPPGNNQRVAALFLSLGYHDTLVGRLQRTYQTRWQEMRKALHTHFPGWGTSAGFGGTSVWMRAPQHADAVALAERAREFGVLIEPGDVFFSRPQEHSNFFRLGFSSIPTERIEPGIAALRQAAEAERIVCRD